MKDISIKVVASKPGMSKPYCRFEAEYNGFDPNTSGAWMLAKLGELNQQVDRLSTGDKGDITGTFDVSIDGVAEPTKSVTGIGDEAMRKYELLALKTAEEMIHHSEAKHGKGK